MKFQFTLRSLLAMVLFLAILLSLLRTGASADGLLELPYRLGGLAFWLVLLAPTWLPLFLMDKEARRWARIRPFLAVVPALWYCLLVMLPDLLRSCGAARGALLRVVPVVGTLIACPMLAFCMRGWWRVLVVPLTFAIVAGTASLEVIAWSE